MPFILYSVWCTQMTINYLVLLIITTLVMHNSCALTLDGRDTLLLGDSLTANQTLISKNGTFALGFFNPNGTKNWYIGIWYAPLSQKAIVWVANRDNPVTNMPGLLKFSRSGQLGLFDGKGFSVWSIDGGEKVSRAVITDSGNFIMLSDGQNESEIVWETFGHPTDTWLPGMKMWKGMKLTSWKSSSDPGSGLFSFGMDTSPGKTQTMLFFNNTVPYGSSGECSATNYFGKVPELEGQKKVQFSCVKLSPSRIYINFSVSPMDHTLTGRLVLNTDGELQLYFWMDDDRRWGLRWSTYGGQCSDYQICGAYGLCNLNDVCSCVQGFTPKNGSQNWWSNGCARRVPLNCITDGFLEEKKKYLSEREAVLYKNENTQESCRAACHSNCSCTAFSFSVSDDPAFCKLWFGDLLGARVTSEGKSVFIRVAASELQRLATEKSIHSPALRVLLSAAAVFLAVLALLVAAFFLWKHRRLWKTGMEDDEVPISLKKFSYKVLRIATENFNHKLGSGAFGSVFRGSLPDGKLVAVKRLEGSLHGEKQFRAEIMTVGMLQHVNLVRLDGFCVEQSERLLVYEYMPNGSLNSVLFSKSKSAEKVLDWKTRFQIALGTARGLVYLHEECRDRIIHSDIKPENILLDDNFRPKIADFGLAKVMGRDFSRVVTTTRGTRGYLAPEWISGLPITSKVDVYSFGMTLLEILSGRRNLEMKVEAESRFYFPTWASCQIREGKIIDIVDGRIGSEVDMEEVRRAAVVAGLCIQDDENERPSMSEVVKILEGTKDATLPKLPRSLHVLLDQLGDDDSDSCGQNLSGWVRKSA